MKASSILTEVTSLAVAPLPQAANKRAVKLEGLQALRAVAALLVVLDHTILNMIDAGRISPNLSLLAYEAGAFGVNLFFAISGFIMTLSSPVNGGLKGSTDFLLRRVWRVVPLYWAATIVYACWLAVDHRAPSSADLFRSLFFIPYFDARLIYHPVLGPGWTLNFEMYFYLVFGLALLLPTSIVRPTIITFLLMSIGVGLAAGWESGAHGPYLKFLTDASMLYFAIGVTISMALPRLPHLEIPVWLFFVGLGLCIAAALTLSLDPSGQAFFVGCAIVVPVLLLIAIHSRALTNAGAIAALFVLIGDASYSLYLTHTLVIGRMTHTALLLSNWAVISVPFGLLMIATCSFIGILTYRYLETPLLARLRPFFVRRP